MHAAVKYCGSGNPPSNALRKEKMVDVVKDNILNLNLVLFHQRQLGILLNFFFPFEFL